MRQIDAAKSEVLVMAYGLSNAAILDAIGRAKARGVQVTALLDKSNQVPVLVGKGNATNGRPERWCVEVLIDGRSAMAHNGVIVIDGRHVINGSFNFTEADHNHVLLMNSEPKLAQQLVSDFELLAAKALPADLRPCP